MNMRGMLDVDFLCMKKIFKLLTPLELCSMRQSCTQLKEFVEECCRSLYFTREQWLDLREENMRNVKRILNNFGKFIRRLKVNGETMKPKLLLDVITINCHDVLKVLSLFQLRLYNIDMKRYAGIFNNLDNLEFIDCRGDQNAFENILFGREHANLTTLNVKYSNVGRQILKKFFITKRNIKKLSCGYLHDDILPLIVRNASEMEELDIAPGNDRNLMLLTQLNKLKRLQIDCYYCDQRSIIALIKELSVIKQLEMLGLKHFELTDDFCESLSLTNLKVVRLWNGRHSLKHTESIELLGQNLPKLESLMLYNCVGFRYRNFLDKFRTLFLYSDKLEINNFIESMVKDFSGTRGRSDFVFGNPLHVYLHEETFDDMKELLTQGNLKSIEEYGNIKIRRANYDVFD